eukprot:125229-Rhodomonas_salina.1
MFWQAVDRFGLQQSSRWFACSFARSRPPSTNSCSVRAGICSHHVEDACCFLRACRDPAAERTCSDPSKSSENRLELSTACVRTLRNFHDCIFGCINI